MNGSLKTMSTQELLGCIDDKCYGFALPEQVLERLDALGTHVFQSHSIHNTDPDDELVHARCIFKFYDENKPGDIPNMVHIPRERWNAMADFMESAS